MMRVLLPALLLAAAQGSKENSTALFKAASGQKTGRCLAVFHTEWGFTGSTHLAALPEANRCYTAPELYRTRNQRLASGFFWADAGCRLRIWHFPDCKFERTFFNMDARDRTEPLTWAISDIGRYGLLPVSGTPYFNAAICECGGDGGDGGGNEDAGDEDEEDEDDDDMAASDAEEDEAEEGASSFGEADEEDGDEDDDMGGAASEDEAAQEEGASSFGDGQQEDKGPVELDEPEEAPVSLASEASGWIRRRRAFFTQGHSTCSYYLQKRGWYSPHTYGQLDANECQTLSKSSQRLHSWGYAFVEEGCRLEFYRFRRCRGGGSNRWKYAPAGQPLSLGVARLERTFNDWEKRIVSVKCRCW